MIARISFEVNTPFDNEEESMEWIDSELNPPEGAISFNIDCGGISKSGGIE